MKQKLEYCQEHGSGDLLPGVHHSQWGGWQGFWQKVMTESRSSSSSEMPAAEWPKMTAHLGSNNSSKTFETLSVMMIDIFRCNGVWLDYVATFLHHIVSSVMCWPVNHDKIGSSSELWACLSTKPDVRCDAHTLCTAQLLDGLQSVRWQPSPGVVSWPSQFTAQDDSKDYIKSSLG